MSMKYDGKTHNELVILTVELVGQGYEDTRATLIKIRKLAALPVKEQKLFDVKAKILLSLIKDGKEKHTVGVINAIGKQLGTVLPTV